MSVQVTRVGIVDASGNTIEYPASLVGSDAQHDIAVLLIDAPDQRFVPVQVGTSANLRTGQSVYAIGNPLGFSKTLTAGVVSGVNRAIPSPVGTKTYGAIQVCLRVPALVFVTAVVTLQEPLHTWPQSLTSCMLGIPACKQSIAVLLLA